jgi:hypothetical protein
MSAFVHKAAVQIEKDFRCTLTFSIYLAVIEPNIVNAPNRNIGWWGRWVFATFAMAFGIYLLVGVLALPLIGYAVLESMFSSAAPLYFLLLSAVSGPFLYKRLG